MGLGGVDVVKATPAGTARGVIQLAPNGVCGVMGVIGVSGVIGGIVPSSCVTIVKTSPSTEYSRSLEK